MNSLVVKIIDESDKNETWKKFVGEYQPEQVFKTIAACEYKEKYECRDDEKQQLIKEIENYQVGNQIIDISKYGGDRVSQWTTSHFIRYLYEKKLGNKFVMKDKTNTVPTNKEKSFHRLDNWQMYAAYGIPLILIGAIIIYWKNFKVNTRKEEGKDI